MTTVQRVTLIFGVAFIILGVVGLFTPGGMTMREGTMLGLFPVNVLHNLVHLAFGIWGLAAWRAFASARSYAQIGGIVYLLLAILAFPLPKFFGLIPIDGHDVWLHALIGIVLVAVGFSARETAPARAI